jgi:two-component system, chemotaxis family, CheB/CheR fusion protein
VAEPKRPSRNNRSRTPASGSNTSSDPAVDVGAQPQAPESTAAAQSAPFPIVGIGASAGGLAAFEAFFSSMPPESGIAFALVQHLSPDHKSILVELVKRYTRMHVFEVEDGMQVQPNCAYIIPPNRDMSLADGVLSLIEPAAPRGQRMPIDFFFRSLAAAQRERAICLVLSGSGSDGTLGVRAIKGEGGMAMAQAPDSTEHDGMPRSAIATGLVDYVLPPAQMPQQLIAYVRHAYNRGQELTPKERDSNVIKKVCALLHVQTGHDFSQYKVSTLVRRMERRMALQEIVQADEYLHYARERPGEVEALFRDLLIGVTNFFRDPEAFHVLEKQVVPRLLSDRSLRDPIRVWVCGCSTGEEAYSIAILLQEAIEAARRAYKVQIFATDIDHGAIEQARLGVFLGSIVADVSPERLARYFTHDTDTGSYRIHKTIRDLVVFSEQDFLKDPPFSRLDLISCRNLLIYLNTDVQKRLIPLFHYALKPGGALFLGTSESVGDSAPQFEVVDRKWKIYFRQTAEPGAAPPPLPEFIPPLVEGGARTRRAEDSTARQAHGNLRQIAEHALLDHYAQAGVLINPRGDILHIIGRTGNFLEFPAGDAVLNILSMARDGLRRELTVAVHKSALQKQPVVCRGLRIRANGGHTTVDVVVRPAGGASSELYMVILEETEERAMEGQAAEAVTSDEGGVRIAELEQELRTKEEYLQTALEEMETSNEELKSTNEEMQSVNEELQSTNEELETSKEELQSVNEELSTVNAELQDRVADLSRANNDMNNLLAGTGIGMVFVDHQMRISRFTPAATQVINLIAGDVGRPVEHVVSNLVGYDHLSEDIRTVLENLTPIEAEVQVKSGGWYLMRIRPYRTMENVIEGAVLTLVDISERKRAEASLRESEVRFQSVVGQAYAGVFETDLSGRFTYSNRQYCEMLGYSGEELLHRRMQDITHPDDLPDNVVQFDTLVANGPDFVLEKRYLRKDGSSVWMMTRMNGMRDAGGRVRSLVGIAFDISDRKLLEAELSRTDAQLARYFEVIARVQTAAITHAEDSSAKEVLEEILDAAIAIGAADKGSIHLLDPSSRKLRIAAQRGFDALWNEVDADLGEWGSALKTGRRVLVEDVAQSSIFSKVPALQGQLGARAMQSSPLIGGSGRPLGILSTYFAVAHLPDERTLRLLDLLARQTGDILERAQTDQRRREEENELPHTP